MRKVTDWGEPPVHDVEAVYDIVDALVSSADGRGVSATQVALARRLTRPGVAGLVIGARTDVQFADHLAAATLTLTAEEAATRDRARRRPLACPCWHQCSTAADRLSSADLALLAPYLED